MGLGRNWGRLSKCRDYVGGGQLVGGVGWWGRGRYVRRVVSVVDSCCWWWWWGGPAAGN